MNFLPNTSRVSVVREDLFLLTKDTYKAIALNQFIKWSSQIPNADKYIEEEVARLSQTGATETFTPLYGWFLVEIGDLIDGAMLSMSHQIAYNLRRSLVDDGYLFLRRRIKRYRLDSARIMQGLQTIGYWPGDFTYLLNSEEGGRGE